jgi:hypothetical protein
MQIHALTTIKQAVKAIVFRISINKEAPGRKILPGASHLQFYPSVRSRVTECQGSFNLVQV